MENKPIKFFKQKPEPGSKDIINHNKKLYDSGWKSSINTDEFLMNDTKLAWHKDRLSDWGKNISNASLIPLHIDMGIATGCNLACHFCYGVIQSRTGFLGTQGSMIFMPLDTIKNTFLSAKEVGVKSIALIGEGENTLNPNLYPALDFARSINLDISLATHGANLNKNHFLSLLQSLSWLRINISAASHSSYINVHQRPWFNKVLKNTEDLLDYRDKNNITLMNNEKCTIGFQMVVTHRNFDQILPLSHLAVNLGIDYLVIKSCSDTPDNSLSSPTHEYLELKNIFSSAEKLSNDRTKIIVRWEKLGNLGNKSYKTCYGTRFIIAISGNGNVFPCGHWFDIEKDRFIMGNVNSDSLKSILLSDKYKKSQNEILKLDLRNCETNCRQHQVNITLDKLSKSTNILNEISNLEVLPSQKHINFI